MNAEQALLLIARYRLHLSPMIFEFSCYTLEGTSSPEGHGTSPIEAVENWAWKIWNEPVDRWFYSVHHRRAVAEEAIRTALTKPRISLEELGL